MEFLTTSIQNFDDEDSLLDTESDVKPVFCRALNKIDGECGVKLAKCFTKSDSDQERIQRRFQLDLLNICPRLLSPNIFT